MSEAIFSRVSVRQFADQKVEQDKIEKILRAAMAAPSAGNQQPWEFYVVTNQNVLERLGEATKYSAPAGKAPLVIAPCYRNRSLRFADYVQQDMSACVENILLEATELGLGSVWMGIAPKEGRMEICRNILNVPSHLGVFALIAIGYPEGEVPAQQDRYDEERLHVIGY